MSAIDITQAIPQRLFFSEDTWCLEVQRWQNLDRDVFNPIRSFIIGTAKVNAYLKETKASPQGLAQSRDILASPGASGASYEYNGREWLLETEFVDYSPAESASTADELEHMKHYVSDLEQRLAQLEQRLSGHLPGNDANLSAHTFDHEELPHSSTG
jgi:hypothetical protein